MTRSAQHGAASAAPSVPAAALLLLAGLAMAMAAAFGMPFLGLLGASARAQAEGGAPTPAIFEECGAAALEALDRRASSPEANRGADAPVLFSNSINLGPELAWRTPFRVVGAPYRRGGEAIADTVAFFAAADDAAARAVAARRQASMVLLCAPRPGEEEAVAGASLLGRLRRGEAPEWLAPVPLPGAPAGVLLFAVRRPPPAAGGALPGG